MENSQIGWTTHTFNPWIGCARVSPGCQHCYAEKYGARFGVKWGVQGDRVRTSEGYWKKPLTWNKTPYLKCDQCGAENKATMKGHRFVCPECESTALTPTRQRVFCASLADVFEDKPELIPWRIELFALIQATPNLDWLLLTKRPQNINAMLYGQEHNFILGPGDWLENLVIGTSVENQEQAEKRIPALLSALPARARFLSCEPLLGEVDLRKIPILGGKTTYNALTGEAPISPITGLPRGVGNKIDWVIVGGESGADARPMHPNWARSLRDQCRLSGTPFFFKQWGEFIPLGQLGADGQEVGLRLANEDPKKIVEVEGGYYGKVGKHKAGMFLDGEVIEEIPWFRELYSKN